MPWRALRLGRRSGKSAPSALPSGRRRRRRRVALMAPEARASSRTRRSTKRSFGGSSLPVRAPACFSAMNRRYVDRLDARDRSFWKLGVSGHSGRLVVGAGNGSEMNNRGQGSRPPTRQAGRTGVRRGSIHSPSSEVSLPLGSPPTSLTLRVRSVRAWDRQRRPGTDLPMAPLGFCRSDAISLL